jgi:hypothetical protein
MTRIALGRATLGRWRAKAVVPGTWPPMSKTLLHLAHLAIMRSRFTSDAGTTPPQVEH